MTKKMMLEIMLAGGNEGQVKRIVADRVKRCSLERIRKVYDMWQTEWQHLPNGRQLVVSITAF